MITNKTKHKITVFARAFSVFIVFFFLYGPAAAVDLPPAAHNASPEEKTLADLFNVLSVKEPIHLVLIEKDRQRLRVLRHNGGMKFVAEYACATGENQGNKKASGDSRTPEGIYFITRIFNDNKVTIFGKRAFHLDYPNIFDKAAGRGGDGIYIHGTNKKLTPNSTNGCITLKNNDLDELVKFMDMAVTPVVVVQSIDSLAQHKKEIVNFSRPELERFLLPESIEPKQVSFDYLYVINNGQQSVLVGEFSQQWDEYSRRRAYSRSYLEFLPGRGWNAVERIWDITPLYIFPKNPLKIAAQNYITRPVKVALQTLPAEKEILRAAEDERSPEKPLVVAAAPPARVKKAQVNVETTVVSAPEKPAPEPLVVAAAPVPIAKPVKEPAESTSVPAIGESEEQQPGDSYSRNNEKVMLFVEKWRLAWESMQIEPYMECYAQSFTQGSKNWAAWKSYKEGLNKNYSFISVEISDIRINWTETGALVSFRQVYRSDRYSANGEKTLQLVYDDKQWKITKESWKKI